MGCRPPFVVERGTPWTNDLPESNGCYACRGHHIKNVNYLLVAHGATWWLNRLDYLRTHGRHDSRLFRTNCRQEIGNQRQKVGKPVGLCMESDDRDWQGLNVLLVRQIPIHRHEHVKSFGSQGKQFAILNGGPSHLPGGSHVVTDKGAGKTPIDALVQQNSHEADSTSFSFASSRKAITCSRVTEGKPSRNSSIESPASRYSMSVRTGPRVPQNTAVPLMPSGSPQMTDWRMHLLYQK